MKKIILLITCILALENWSLAADIVSIDNFRIAPGETKGFNISLNNDSEYVSFQFDLYLPKGISVESYSVDRNRVPGNTELSMSRQQDGSYRFITMSMDASPISGNSGSIIALSVKASDDLDFNGGTGYFRNVKLSKSNATGPTYQEFSFPIERIYYVVRYRVDGALFQTDTIRYGLPISHASAPYKEGFTFSGWSEIPATMPANDVEVTGSFSINSYKLVYKVDGAEYKALTLDYGTEIAAEPNPTKDGYTFSGWSEIPATMPANNVEVTGSFTVNMYLLKVLINGEIYYSDSIAYGTRLMDYLDLIIQSGIDLSQWELYDNIENITMPAHDVTVTGNITVDGIIGIESNSRFRVYNLAGKFLGEMTDEDLKLLEPGVYIVNNRKIIVK